jgi:hypothetical protein
MQIDLHLFEKALPKHCCGMVQLCEIISVILLLNCFKTSCFTAKVDVEMHLLTPFNALNLLSRIRFSTGRNFIMTTTFTPTASAARN